MPNFFCRLVVPACAVFSVAAGLAHAQPVPYEVLLSEGGTLDGREISSFGAPFTNGQGQVGLLIYYTDGSRGYYYDGAVIFNSVDDAPAGVTLTGGESTTGLSAAGDFAYSPSYNGLDSTYSSNGILVLDESPAPGLPDGYFLTSNSRVRMADDGEVFWVSGYRLGAGSATQYRAFYRQAPGDAEPTAVYKWDDDVGGFRITIGSAVDFDYDVSNSGDGLINVLVFAEGAGIRRGIVINGQIAHLEGETLTPGGTEAFGSFDATRVSIADSGDYAFVALTDADVSQNRVLFVNGSEVTREGDTVDGFDIGAIMDALSIDKNGRLLTVWDSLADNADEALVYFHDPLGAGSGEVVMRVGDALDLDGDTDPDAFVENFDASGTIGYGLDTSGRGDAFVVIEAGGREHLLRVKLPNPCPGDHDRDGTKAAADIIGYVTDFKAGDFLADTNNDGELTARDIVAFISAYRRGC